MTKKAMAAPEAAFKHNISIGPNGEILYDCPIEIKSKEDLQNYGIGWEDCRTLSFHGSEKITVYFYKTKNRDLAEYQWGYLNTQHSKGYRITRCMIPGILKTWIRCPDTNSCINCPYKDVKKSPIISWEGLVEAGYEPTAIASAEEQAIEDMEYHSIKKAVMESADGVAGKVLEMKELGYSVAEIAEMLHIKEQRAYRLISRGKFAYKEIKGTNC